MPSNVGDAINYKGRRYLVTSIEKRQAQMFAPENNTEMEAGMRSSVNSRFVGTDILFEEFEEGDIINLYCEYCILRAGDDTQFIYTKYKVKKEIKSGQNEQPPNANQAANPTAQTTNQRA